MSDFLERNGLQTVAQHFKDLFLASVHRDGAEELLERLENETDFFEAPAGAKHHGAFPGGLVIHSLNVYRRLREITIRDLTPRDALGPAPISEQEEETVAILGLLHDVCKAGVYHIERKRRRNPETGVWEDYLDYTFRDPLPLGHGEKSLYQIARFIRLEDHEALAIRWHMGAYDTAARTDLRDLSAAMDATPWVWRLHEADMTSVTERARRERWQVSGCARVVSRKYGTVVVPHGSNFAALLNAAEVWGCDWTEIRDAEVWRADKEERPVPMPHLI